MSRSNGLLQGSLNAVEKAISKLFILVKDDQHPLHFEIQFAMATLIDARDQIKIIQKNIPPMPEDDFITS